MIQETVWPDLWRSSGWSRVGSCRAHGCTDAEGGSQAALCQVAKPNDWHSCIEVDNPPRMGLGSVDRHRVVVRGM